MLLQPPSYKLYYNVCIHQFKNEASALQVICKQRLAMVAIMGQWPGSHTAHLHTTTIIWLDFRQDCL